MYTYMCTNKIQLHVTIEFEFYATFSIVHSPPPPPSLSLSLSLSVQPVFSGMDRDICDCFLEKMT